MSMDRRTFGRRAAGLAATASLAHGPASAAARGIDEGLFVPINGMDQWITLRGKDLRNPVLLFLHGGPGIASSDNAPVFASWEADFTVVQWDQPGSGATHAKNLATDTGPFTTERYLADAIAVAEWTRKRLGVRKLIVMGASWGTVLGVLMVQHRPDLASVYVGAGQVVSRAEGDMVGYRLALDRARARGDTAGVERLTKLGPPPYATVDEWFVRQQYTNPPFLPPTPAEVAATAEAGRLLRAVDPAKATWLAKGVPEFNVGANFFAVQRATYANHLGYEAAETFRVPVFIIQGEHDLNTPTPVARQYFERLKAPAKAYAEVPGASHNVVLFHGEVLAFLKAKVRPAALRARG